MASDAQIAANRRNSASSTGPRTEAGKAASAQNALRHGLAAKQLVIFDEREEDFRSMLDGLRAAFAPADAYEEGLVEHIAVAQWRLRRVWRAEAAAINEEALALAQRRARSAAHDALEAELKAHPPAGMEKASPEDIARAASAGVDALAELDLMAGTGDGDAEAADEPLVLDTAIWPERLNVLSRYEAALERMIHRATRTLERLHARRRYEELAAQKPVSAEVTAKRNAAIEESVQRRAREAANPWENDKSYQATMKFVKRSQSNGAAPREDAAAEAPSSATPPPQ